MGLEPSFTRGRETELEWLRDLYEQHRKLETELPEFEEFKRDSCFFYSHNTDYVAFQNNIQQGVPFGTPSGKIELFSKRLFDLKNPKEIPGTPSYTPCVEGPSDPLIKKYPLQLIGFHTKRRCHSCLLYTSIDQCCRTAAGRFLKRLRNYATADSWILSLLLAGRDSPLRIKPRKRLWISWSG